MTALAERTQTAPRTAPETAPAPLPQQLVRRGDTHVTARVVAAALLLAVSYIHLADQNFLAFDKSPGYLLVGYVIVEIAAPITALVLARHPSVATWLVAAGCGAGPMLGFVLTRSTGLPGATDDIGNWGEPLGVASLVVEGTLLLLAVTEGLRLFLTRRRTA